MQGRDRRVRQAQRRQGQGSDGRRLAARRHHRAVPAGPRQRRRRVRRAGDGASDRHPGAGEARRHRVEQRLLAAVQVRRAGDVEQQAVGRVHRRQRRDAERPEGEAPEPGRVRFRLGGVQRDVRQDLLRVRQCLSWLQPRLRRRRVHRQHHLAGCCPSSRPRAAPGGAGARCVSKGRCSARMRRRGAEGEAAKGSAGCAVVAVGAGCSGSTPPPSAGVRQKRRLIRTKSRGAAGALPRSDKSLGRGRRRVALFGRSPSGAVEAPRRSDKSGARLAPPGRAQRERSGRGALVAGRGCVTRTCPRRPWNVLPSTGTRSTARRIRRPDF